MSSNFSEEFLHRIQQVTNKRPRTVIDHILKHGFVTTAELKEIYGYNHPPRAARDVREEGIPLETFRITTDDGRRIAAYRFADESQARADLIGGRKIFSKKFKQQLIDMYGSSCAIHLEDLEERYLQVDHRVPYQISGDQVSSGRKPEDYMLLCGSANRAKSWSCEHCENWQNQRLESVCRTCYWAYPDNYTHIAMRQVRRVDLTWTDEDVAVYDRLRAAAAQAQQDVQAYIKEIISRFLHSK